MYIFVITANYEACYVSCVAIVGCSGFKPF